MQISQIGNSIGRTNTAVGGSDELIATLRAYAHNKLDAEVFNHIRPFVGSIQFYTEDLMIVASVLNEAARLFVDFQTMGKPDDDIEDLVGVVTTVLASAELPAKPSADRAFREYFSGMIRWCEALRHSPYVNRFWDVIGSMLLMGIGSFPDMRETLVSLVADIGRRITLAEPIQDAVLRAATRPHHFASPGNFLKVLGYVLHHRISRSDISGIANAWLASWCHHFSTVDFFRRSDSDLLLTLKSDIHARLAKMFGTSGILLGRVGGVRTSLILLLIKLDCHIARWRKGLVRPWTWFLAKAFGVLRRGRAGGDKGGLTWPDLRLWQQLHPARQTRLSLLDVPVLRGGPRDVLITRVQGGIGDIIAMRPGMVELARRRRGRRIIFATNRAFFPAFSIDDPIELVDIERTEIDTASFGRWVNMSDCPATRAEAKELPRLRTNRVDIFARAVGIRFLPLSRKRIRPIRFADTVETTAADLLAEHSRLHAKCIGIQARSAESYKDFPAILDVARALAKHHNVFVFDSRHIPRRSNDKFTAIDNQSMAVAMAMASKMDLVVSLDSSFIHVAGCNRVPCLMLSGPSDGKVRRKPYPTVRYLDVRRTLGCIPCWRNEFQKCGLSDSFHSICMTVLSVPMVVEAVEAMLEKPHKPGASPWSQWIEVSLEEWRNSFGRHSRRSPTVT